MSPNSNTNDSPLEHVLIAANDDALPGAPLEEVIGMGAGMDLSNDELAVGLISTPLPDTHWLYAEGRNVPPMGLRIGTEHKERANIEQRVREAAKFALRATTGNGVVEDFDPDAFVQNMVVGLLGYHTPDGLSDISVENPRIVPRPYIGFADEIDQLTARKDGAYEERNYVVAALAKIFPSGIRDTEIEGWHPEWHGCVYIDLPTGQISYHYHSSLKHLFADLPAYTKPYDGHVKNDVHARLSALGFGPDLRYLEEYIADHREIVRMDPLDVRADELANVTMWCDKLDKFIAGCRKGQALGKHPKEFWN